MVGCKEMIDLDIKIMSRGFIYKLPYKAPDFHNKQRRNPHRFFNLWFCGFRVWRIFHSVLRQYHSVFIAVRLALKNHTHCL